MKKNVVKIAIILLGVLVLYTSSIKETFIGNKTKKEDCYILRFEQMNQIDSHTLVLEKDDILSVDFEIKQGNIDLIIGMENEEIYRGNGIETGTFELIVSKDGEYTITVKSKHASGFIQIVKKEVLMMNDQSYSFMYLSLGRACLCLGSLHIIKANKENKEK